MTATATGQGIAGGLVLVAGMGFFALTRWYVEGGWRGGRRRPPGD